MPSNWEDHGEQRGFEKHVHSHSAEPRRILVVDDDPAVLGLMQFILLEEGFEVCCVKSGLEALREFRASHWDMVITDGIMPGMNGDELAAQMRRVGPPLPILLVSGFAKELARADLFDAVLPKPFTLASLLAAVESLWDHHHALAY